DDAGRGGQPRAVGEGAAAGGEGDRLSRAGHHVARGVLDRDDRLGGEGGARGTRGRLGRVDQLRGGAEGGWREGRADTRHADAGGGLSGESVVGADGAREGAVGNRVDTGHRGQPGAARQG